MNSWHQAGISLVADDKRLIRDASAGIDRSFDERSTVRAEPQESFIRTEAPGFPPGEHGDRQTCAILHIQITRVYVHFHHEVLTFAPILARIAANAVPRGLA